MDNFRDSYFNVTWDLTQKHLRGTFWGKQYDTGRGFAVTIVEGGKVTVPSTETVRLKWEKPDGTEGYVTAVVVDNKFIIEDIDQMFTVHGAVRSDLEISRGGKVISSITFYVSVEKAVAVDAIESSSQFTALQDAIATVDNITELNSSVASLDSDVDSLETQFNNVIANVTVDSEVIAARGPEPTLGARLDATEQEIMSFKEDYAKQAEFPLINLVKNGDFSAGIAEWDVNGSTISVVENVLKQTSTSDGANVYQIISNSNLAGDKLYIRVNGRRLNDKISSLQLHTFNGTVASTVTQFIPPIDTWESLSTVIVQPPSGTYVRVYLRMNTSLIGTIAEWSNILVVNLTATFGAGNEPTEEQMDLIIDKFNGWFDGKVQLSNLKELYFKTKEIEDNIGTIEDESITIDKIQGAIPCKNLFNPQNIEDMKYIDPSTNTIIVSGGYNLSEPIPVTIGEKYTIYNGGSIGYFDENLTLVSSEELVYVAGTSKTITATQPYIRVSVHDTHLNNTQVEKGSEFTGYESYKKVIPLSLIEPFQTGGGSGEAYDQTLNTIDSVKFASVTTTGNIPTGTLSNPPSGIVKGDAWADTTDSVTHPIIRVML